MKLAIRSNRAGPGIRWARYIFAAIGVLALGYCLAVYLSASFFQTRAARNFSEALRSKELLIPPSPRTIAPVPTPEDGALLGRLEIPRLGVAVMVVQGVKDGDLRRAAGHIPGTALPGEPGNVGIAAHRDTFFRPLRRIAPDDTITLDTLRGKYYYRVVSTKIVPPQDVGVLYPTGHDTLTLVTCYPFDYIGPAPKRFIVKAERIRTGSAPHAG